MPRIALAVGWVPTEVPDGFVGLPGPRQPSRSPWRSRGHPEQPGLSTRSTESAFQAGSSPSATRPFLLVETGSGSRMTTSTVPHQGPGLFGEGRSVSWSYTCARSSIGQRSRQHFNRGGYSRPLSRMSVESGQAVHSTS